MRLLGFEKSVLDYGWDDMIKTPIASNQKLNPPEILFIRIENEAIQKEIDALHAMNKNHSNQTLKIEEVKKTMIQENPPTNELELALLKEVKENLEVPPLKEMIEYNDFQKLDLRVATIIAADVVPKSKKLLKLQVDLGFEKRQIISGISQYYKPEDLIGKKVVVVANLKPAVLMGIESHGMLLAAHLEDQLEIVKITTLPNGSVVS